MNSAYHLTNNGAWLQPCNTESNLLYRRDDCVIYV